MKKLYNNIIILLLLVVSNTLIAQYNLSVDAPQNEVPIKFHKDHFNLKGNVKVFDNMVSEYTFNKQGFLIKQNGIMSGETQYVYDKNNKLKLIIVDANKSNPLNYEIITDSRGRPIEKKRSSYVEKYEYDRKGNYIKKYKTNSFNNLFLAEEFTYDKKNRVIQYIYYRTNGEVSFIHNYRYKKEGDFLKLTISKEGNSMNPTISYYKSGVYYGKEKNNKVEYDQYNNPISFPMMKYKYSYHSNSDEDDSTQNKNIDCVYGDCQNGWGRKDFNGGYYIGFWENGKREGYGLFQWNESGKYIGFWKNGEMDGYGTYLGIEKDMIGEYKSGFLEGFGFIYDKTTNKTEQGIFSLYLLKEEFVLNSNNISTGCVAGNCQNKVGRYVWKNGDTFNGFFKDGEVYMGNYTFASGDEYSGMFKNNTFNGEGRFFFKDGSYYGGQWKDGQQHGKGYFISKDNSETIGIWENGKLIQKMN